MHFLNSLFRNSHESRNVFLVTNKMPPCAANIRNIIAYSCIDNINVTVVHQITVCRIIQAAMQRSNCERENMAVDCADCVTCRQ